MGLPQMETAQIQSIIEGALQVLRTLEQRQTNLWQEATTLHSERSRILGTADECPEQQDSAGWSQAQCSSHVQLLTDALRAQALPVISGCPLNWAYHKFYLLEMPAALLAECAVSCMPGGRDHNTDTHAYLLALRGTLLRYMIHSRNSPEVFFLQQLIEHPDCFAIIYQSLVHGDTISKSTAEKRQSGGDGCNRLRTLRARLVQQFGEQDSWMTEVIDAALTAGLDMGQLRTEIQNIQTSNKSGGASQAM